MSEPTWCCADIVGKGRAASGNGNASVSGARDVRGAEISATVGESAANWDGVETGTFDSAR
jgi:hypothetical protein